MKLIDSFQSPSGCQYKFTGDYDVAKMAAQGQMEEDKRAYREKMTELFERLRTYRCWEGPDCYHLRESDLVKLETEYRGGVK